MICIEQNRENIIACQKKSRTFARLMDKRRETLNVRIISVGFAVLALAVFKPFGMEELGVMMYVHCIAIWLLGVGGCYVTEAILRLSHMPASLDRGVDYIIRRNLWFQLLNTPLMALIVCSYLHVAIGGKVEAVPPFWKGYLQTLLVLAFCSFTIGMYWRYKFRSRYLMAELEETKMLNEQLSRVQQEMEARVKVAEEAKAGEPGEDAGVSASATPLSSTIVLAGNTSETVTVHVPDLLYIEAVGNYIKVYQFKDGAVRTDMLRATSKQMESDLHDFPMIVRCHRAFLVNLAQVEQIVSQSGSMQLIVKHSRDAIPVSRSNMAGVKEAVRTARAS